MQPVSYRWMIEADIAAVGALAHRIWHAHYPSVITVEQIDFMLARAYTPEHLQRQLAEGQRFLLAQWEDEILGFLSVGPLAAISTPILRGERVDTNSYFLHKFYLATELHRQGIGGAMLQELLRQMPHITRLRLQVARKNRASWKFYQKHGFVIECEADFLVGGGYEMNDYVMEKRLSA